MAAPNNRRPGFSRKAQYSIFATYVLAISGVIVAALLLLISILDPKGFSALRIAGAEASAPISRFFNSIRRTVSDSSDDISFYWDAAAKNKAMDKKIDALEKENLALKVAKLENEKLRSLINTSLIKNGLNDELAIITTGRLISTTASSGRRLALISVDNTQNIKAGQPVISNDGLIGRITEKGITTARILLLTDTGNVVPVIRLSDGLAAFATGQADGSLLIKPLSLGVNPFEKGDILVTSGNGGLYPPNIPVATIIEKLDDSGIAKPLANPATTNYSTILEIYEPIANEELESIREEIDRLDDSEAAP